jgi:hypothetical protein
VTFNCSHAIARRVQPMTINFHFGSSQFITLQKIMVFLTENFGLKKKPYGFLAPMSNLTKVPFWTNQFKHKHFD